MSNEREIPEAVRRELARDLMADAQVMEIFRCTKCNRIRHAQWIAATTEANDVQR
jgi:hypothetical protein